MDDRGDGFNGGDDFDSGSMSHGGDVNSSIMGYSWYQNSRESMTSAKLPQR
ncbi:MAG: hypothetical protein AAGA27_08360 [Pseudomonadota bacterium]